MSAVLSRGELEDAHWLLRTYGRARVRDFVLADLRGRRDLPRGARKLWAAFLFPEVPREELEDRPGGRWGGPGRVPQSTA